MCITAVIVMIYLWSRRSCVSQTMSTHRFCLHMYLPRGHLGKRIRARFYSDLYVCVCMHTYIYISVHMNEMLINVYYTILHYTQRRPYLVVFLLLIRQQIHMLVQYY